MKFGCLLLLLTLGGAFAAYRQLIQETELKDQWWIPGILAFVAMMIVGNIHGLFLAFKQKRASGRQRSEWRDGELVVISGRIQSLRSPMTAPFSGKPCCVLEYEIKSAETDSPSVAEYSGFMMSPCTLVTTQGSVNLVGFPILPKVNSESCVEDTHYTRAGEFIKNTKFKEKESNPMALLKQLNEVLSDTDGDVQAHFGPKNSPFDVAELSGPEIATQLREQGINLEETMIPSGAEVTVSGTYRANKQAIEIGRGISNLNHKLELGTVAMVTGANVRNCLIWIVIASGIFATGNYFLLKHLGLLEKFGMQ